MKFCWRQSTFGGSGLKIDGNRLKCLPSVEELASFMVRYSDRLWIKGFEFSKEKHWNYAVSRCRNSVDSCAHCKHLVKTMVQCKESEKTKMECGKTRKMSCSVTVNNPSLRNIFVLFSSLENLQDFALVWCVH